MKGNFLKAKSAVSGNYFTATFSFTSPISITSFGTYKLSFYTFFNCPRPACLDAGDQITIKYKYGQDGVYQAVFTTGSDDGRIQDVKWKRDEVLINFNSSEVYVSSDFEIFAKNIIKFLFIQKN